MADSAHCGSLFYFNHAFVCGRRLVCFFLVCSQSCLVWHSLCFSRVSMWLAFCDSSGSPQTNHPLGHSHSSTDLYCNGDFFTALPGRLSIQISRETTAPKPNTSRPHSHRGPPSDMPSATLTRHPFSTPTPTVPALERSPITNSHNPGENSEAPFRDFTARIL